MGDLSLKVKIADREYPMKVKSDDEQLIREAAHRVNEKIKNYRTKFGIDDKQDLLAMVAFDSMIRKLRSEKAEEETGETGNKELQDRLKSINNLLTQEL